MQDAVTSRNLLRNADAFGGQRVGDCQRGAAVIQNDRIVALRSAEVTAHPRMVIPAHTDPHCHLDKCHTIGRLGPVAGAL